MKNLNFCLQCLCASLLIIIIVLLSDTKTTNYTKPKTQIVYNSNVDLSKHVVYKKYITVDAKLTAYTPGKESCGIYTDGKTSVGNDAWNMTGIAVAPTAIPYGTKVYIPGIGTKVADDTGSAMRKAWTKHKIVHIDIRMPTVYAARRFGIKYKKVKIYL